MIKDRSQSSANCPVCAASINVSVCLFELWVPYLRTEVEQQVKHAGGYRYEAELVSHNSMSRWLDERRNSARKEIKIDPKIYDQYVVRDSGGLVTRAEIEDGAEFRGQRMRVPKIK